MDPEREDWEEGEEREESKDKNFCLSPLKEAFCRAYAADISRNGTAAAIAAGYTDKPASAAVTASRLLKDVKVRGRIRELEREALAEAGYDGAQMRAMVMREYVRLAFSNITDFYYISPDRYDPSREETIRAIAAMHGGQRPLDFGETLIVPTVCLPDEVTAAIKKVKCEYDKHGDVLGFEIDMHDKLAALRVLAEATGAVKNSVEVTGEDGGPLAFKWALGEGEGKNDE